jgi:hypothetical protein
MCVDRYERKRECFNWRVRRLVERGLLNRGSAPITPSPVYSVTPAAAVILAEHCPILDNGKRNDFASPHHLGHSIGLNELHLALARQGVLDDWQSEVTIRAKNELTPSGYAKDYDAIATVRIGERRVTFALEYERTAKKSKEYLHIRNLLQQENRVYRFLYIVAEPDLGSFILECFAGTTALLLIGLASELTKSFNKMNVIDAASGIMRPIIAAL